MAEGGGPAQLVGKSGGILVVGSINMDLVARCPHIPAPGETIMGSDFSLHPGGKGANGATAAARLAAGTTVNMLGAVGNDANGAALRSNLHKRGVATRHVLTLEGVPTGVALIAVAQSGENSIVVVPGANGHVRAEHVQAVLPSLAPAAILMQLEIPLESVLRAATLARGAGALVLLDPAPAPAALPAGLLALVDVLIPNEGELALLTGLPTDTEDEAARAAAQLRALGVGAVVVKRGEKGALVVDERGARPIAALRVAVVDTTGAGDSFDGALAVALVEGRERDDAARFAAHAAGLACTRLGAQEAQPSRAEVEKTLLS